MEIRWRLTVRFFTSQNGVASARILTDNVESISGIPVFRNIITDCDSIPEHDLDDILIVSALYASAFRKVHPESDAKLYTISDLVYSQDGKTILGCLGICEAF